MEFHVSEIGGKTTSESSIHLTSTQAPLPCAPASFTFARGVMRSCRSATSAPALACAANRVSLLVAQISCSCIISRAGPCPAPGSPAQCTNMVGGIVLGTQMSGPGIAAASNSTLLHACVGRCSSQPAQSYAAADPGRVSIRSTGPTRTAPHDNCAFQWAGAVGG